MVFARNPAGTEATATFLVQSIPEKFPHPRPAIDDSLLDKVVNQIDPTALAPAHLLSRFLKINGDMRRKNNQTLADLRLKTEENLLWTARSCTRAMSRSIFADVRNYIYKGKKVDQQVTWASTCP